MSLSQVMTHENGYLTRATECLQHRKVFAEVFTPFAPQLANLLHEKGTWTGACPDCKRERDAFARDEAEADREIDSRQDEIRAWVMAQMETPAVLAERKKAVADRMAEKLAEYEKRIRADVEDQVNEAVFERLALAHEDAIRAERLARKAV